MDMNTKLEPQPIGSKYFQYWQAHPEMHAAIMEADHLLAYWPKMQDLVKAATRLNDLPPDSPWTDKVERLMSELDRIIFIRLPEEVDARIAAGMPSYGPDSTYIRILDELRPAVLGILREPIRQEYATTNSTQTIYSHSPEFQCDSS
jgi:hypothetical protein